MGKNAKRRRAKKLAAVRNGRGVPVAPLPGTYTLADGNHWTAWQRRMNAANLSTSAWSEVQLGQDAMLLLYDVIAVTDRALHSLHVAITKEEAEGKNLPNFRAAHILFEFAFSRLLDAWGELREGYLFNAAGLERVALESTHRGAYCMLNEDAAKRYLNAEDVQEREVRDELLKLWRGEDPEDVTRRSNPIRAQIDALSPYVHTYTIRPVWLQARIDSPSLISLTRTGVRKRAELLAFFTELMRIMVRIPRLLRDAHDALGWDAQLSAQVADVSDRYDRLETRIIEELERTPPLVLGVEAAPESIGEARIR